MIDHKNMTTRSEQFNFRRSKGQNNILTMKRLSLYVDGPNISTILTNELHKYKLEGAVERKWHEVQERFYFEVMINGLQKPILDLYHQLLSQFPNHRIEMDIANPVEASMYQRNVENSQRRTHITFVKPNEVVDPDKELIKWIRMMLKEYDGFRDHIHDEIKQFQHIKIFGKVVYVQMKSILPYMTTSSPPAPILNGFVPPSPSSPPAAALPPPPPPMMFPQATPMYCYFPAFWTHIPMKAYSWDCLQSYIPVGKKVHVVYGPGMVVLDSPFQVVHNSSIEIELMDDWEAIMQQQQQHLSYPMMSNADGESVVQEDDEPCKNIEQQQEPAKESEEEGEEMQQEQAKKQEAEKVSA